jgi:two-component system chemotaxis sensor kinase CheA
MDLSEYKDQFISEAQDHLDALNEGLLALEKAPEDIEIVNQIFRSFHTLKGNAATMGYTKFSELAHDLENLLSKIRDKQVHVSSDVMDVLLKGCDALEDGLGLIKNDASDELDTHTILNMIHNLSGTKEEVIKYEIKELLELTDEEKAKISSLKSSGKNVFRIIVVFDKKNALKMAKAMVVMRDISNFAEIVKTNPSYADIKSGKFEAEIEFVLSTEKEKEEIFTIINNVSGIVAVNILTPEEKYVSARDNSKEVHIEKEADKADIAAKHGSEMSKQIQSVKVGMDQLDKLMNLVGELLISKIRIDDISKRYELKELTSLLAGLDRLTMDLQSEVMQVRMIPIGNIFNRFPRMVRDLAKTEGKQVELQIVGSEIEFDRTILDEIGDPLVHMLRNSVDHGIETPEKRTESGKGQIGIIQLIARREKNNAIIEVIDDGEGINPSKVKAAAIKKRVHTEEELSKMSDAELQRLIFHPGMSTNEVVTEVSGRGVGMNVVETKVKSLGGNVKLASELGRGTKITLELPLTVAIISALMVKVNEEIYAIPLASVDQTVDIMKEGIKTIKGNEVFILRNKEIPLLRMHRLFELQEKEKTKFTVVIINKEDEKIGLVVDEIISQQQILIKSLDRLLKGTKAVAGATILGNGKVALILDLATMIS